MQQVEEDEEEEREVREVLPDSERRSAHLSLIPDTYAPKPLAMSEKAVSLSPTAV